MAPVRPTFWAAFRFWLKLGFISFGGPTGQIAIMHTELVEKRRWIDESRFFHALNFCVLLPGPEAQQLAIYLGWLLHGTRGGLVAGTLFVLPAALLLWALSWIYVLYGNVWWLAAAFDGLKPAVLAIVAAAAVRIGRKVLRRGIHWLIAAGAFAALFFGSIPFPLIVLGAALLGYGVHQFWPDPFSTAPTPAGTIMPPTGVARTAPPTLRRTLKVAAVGLLLWWTPVWLLGAILGRHHTLFQQGVFFSQAAMITFGGAYAILPYVSQQAVESYGWLAPGEMLDGLGLAESTPGPLIMVLQFVGFVGAWKFPQPFSPVVAATLGAAITTWTTFVPCFLWIFMGAPYVEGLRENPRWQAALAGITAAVVGVILKLALWFGGHVLFPTGQPMNGFGLAIALGVFLGLVWRKWDLLPVILVAAALGVGHRALS